MTERAHTSGQALVARGVSWNLFHQIFQIILNFSAMIVLVRIMPPEEYGRWGAVVGFLTLLNTFNCGVFMSHAVQLPERVEPDWSLHWSVGFWIQLSLSIVCNLIAGVCWFYLAYRPAAPLLHLASAGLVIDVAAQLRVAMLRRALNFRRLVIVGALGATVGTAVTLGVGLAGWGAYAIVLGANVLLSVPFAVDLLMVQQWRPRVGWWRWPDWASYGPALRFGLQNSGSGLLYGARGMLEATVLPGVLGFPAMGLMNRAQALFNSTLGRLGNVFVETAYPLLPRYSGDRRQYTRQATEFAQSILLVMIPGTFYLGLEGAAISRVLYGEKWVDADPLIWPGALLGLGLAMLTVSTSILLAVNRLRACFLLSVMSAALGAPLVTLAWVTQNLVFYAWSLAVGQLVAGLIAFATAASLFNRGWLRTVLVPPVASSVFAAGLALVAHDTVGQGPLWIHLSLSLALYVLATLLILRAFFLDAFAILMSRFPGGSRMQDWLGPRPARVLSNDS